MKEKKIKSLEGYGEFREMCFPFLLEEEYPGWTGEEKWGIVTDFSEDALLEEYPKIMEALSPYLMLPSGYGEIRREYENNERRSRRAKESESLFGYDEDTEVCHPALVSEDFTQELADRELLKEAFACITGIQKERVYKHYFLGMSLKEIAESEGEGASKNAVWESIRTALKKMRDFIEGFGGEI